VSRWRELADRIGLWVWALMICPPATRGPATPDEWVRELANLHDCSELEVFGMAARFAGLPDHPAVLEADYNAWWRTGNLPEYVRGYVYQHC